MDCFLTHMALLYKQDVLPVKLANKQIPDLIPFMVMVWWIHKAELYNL